MMKVNGHIKVTLPIAVGSFGVGIITAAIWFGAAVERMEYHISNPAIHETERLKLTRIDDRVDLKLGPLLVEMREANRRLATIERQLEP